MDKDNNWDNVVTYNRTQGNRESLNENLIPEQLFDDPETDEKEADGISAVKAIALANQQGQTVYTITKDNYSEVLPNLNHGDDVMTDIRNAVYANKEVTVHQSQLNFKGWTGSGYIIIDPKTGVGGYMIGGGVDGGWTNSLFDWFKVGFLLGLLGGAGIVLALGGTLVYGVMLFVLAAALIYAMRILLVRSGKTEELDCFQSGVAWGALISQLFQTKLKGFARLIGLQVLLGLPLYVKAKDCI